MTSDIFAHRDKPAVVKDPASRCEASVPKGQEDSARGFNPGEHAPKRVALKGRKGQMD
jgi:hypothetical protein